MKSVKIDRRRRGILGRGVVNTPIKKLPFEMHLPGGYQYAGHGTKLEKRLALGDIGKNPLDAACKHHEAYAKYPNYLKARHQANNQL